MRQERTLGVLAVRYATVATALAGVYLEATVAGSNACITAGPCVPFDCRARLQPLRHIWSPLANEDTRIFYER
jgi:hypothetical protein